MEDFRNKVVIVTGSGLSFHAAKRLTILYHGLPPPLQHGEYLNPIKSKLAGASAGIGAETAITYAKHGGRLALGGRNVENLNKTKQQCMEAGLEENEVLLVLGDLTEEDACNKLVDQTIDKFGQIDILVNNAGSGVTGNLENCTLADLDLMYKTHVRSTFMMSKRAAPHLIKTKGSILNVSSVASFRQSPNIIAYGMAKASVNHMTGTIAQDLAPKGINVNAIAPAVIKTNIFLNPGMKRVESADALPAFFEAMAAKHPIGRVGTVEEVAANILHLTSEAASFITGTIVPIDGGLIGKVE